jgi:hypothetical protein
MFRLFSVTLLLALSVPALAQQTEASDGVTDEIPSEDSGQWLWSVTPYLWAVVRKRWRNSVVNQAA